MNYKQNEEILLKILNASTSDELEIIIKGTSFFKDVIWIPYGNRPNNAGEIDQMLEPENAFIEKPINSIDAILMRKCRESGIDPTDKEKAPKSVTEAIEKYFGGKEKLREKRSDIAKEWLWITAEGRKERPTITIIDKGEGQQPNKIKETILSLGGQIKEKIPFVYGTYNKGGSAPLGFAGNPDFYDVNHLQLVLCRRADTIRDKNRDWNYNHFGFTLVRKRFDGAAQKFIYEYFVEKGSENIFSFLFIKPIRIHDYEFSEGCLIKLYDYQLPPSLRGNIVFRGLNELIEKKFPDIPFPIYLKELRDYAGDRDYTIFGLKEKLYKKPLRIGYPQRLPLDLGNIGKRDVELFILEHKANTKEDIESYIEEPAKIFFTRSGLVVHTENASWLRNECELPDLAPYFFLFIDISNMNPALAQMLHSGKVRFKDNETTRLALGQLRIFLNNETLKELDREYSRLTVSSDIGLKDETLKKQVMKEIGSQPELREYFELGDEIPIKEEIGDKPGPSFEGSYLPEKFALLGENPRKIEEGSFCKITFDTGAENKLFERQENRGEYDWINTEKFHVTFNSFKNGKITFRIDPNKNLRPPAEETILFFLRVPAKNIEFTGTATIILQEKSFFEGNLFPTFFKPVREIFKIPIKSERKLDITTDVENNYFLRKEEPGYIEIESRKDLKFGKPRLKDGLLQIKVSYPNEKLGKLDDIKFTVYDDGGHKFDLSIPVEAIPPGIAPELNLPDPVKVYREDWEKDTPVWSEQMAARIPSWKELKKIKINLDSKPFNEIRKMNLPDKELAKDLLFKEIYKNSIWVFLEFKDLNLNHDNFSNSKYNDPRDEIFDRAVRAYAKNTIQNIKKLLR